jgi:AcrR family transcriptional regulator
MDDLVMYGESLPSRADALKNRALLLETARRLFSEQGVEAVSMTAIADAARVGKGTLYRHFENKAQLCQALLDDDQRALQERTFARMRQHHDPVGNLRWFIAEVVEFVWRNSAFLCVGSDHDAIVSLTIPAHLWWRQTVRALLEQAGAPLDLDYAADVIYLMMDVHTLYFQRTVLGYDRERIISGLTATMLQLLKP